MQVKGVSIRTLFAAIESAFGGAALARVKAALAPDTTKALEPIVLASASYPVEVSAAIHQAVRDVLGAGSVTANRKVGSEAARIDFGGIYRVFIRLADFRTLLEGLDRAWRQYNSQGSVEWTFTDRSEARGTVRDVEGYSEAMWHSVAGRLEAILILSGAKKATVSVVDWSSHDVTFHVRWTP